MSSSISESEQASMVYAIRVRQNSFFIVVLCFNMVIATMFLALRVSENYYLANDFYTKFALNGYEEFIVIFCLILQTSHIIPIFYNVCGYFSIIILLYTSSVCCAALSQEYK